MYNPSKKINNASIDNLFTSLTFSSNKKRKYITHIKDDDISIDKLEHDINIINKKQKIQDYKLCDILTKLCNIEILLNKLVNQNEQNIEKKNTNDDRCSYII